MNRIKKIEKKLDEIAGAEIIKEKLSKARRTLKKDNADKNKIYSFIDEAKNIYILEKEWRKKAENELLPQLIKFNNSIKNTIGLRLQEKLTKDQATKSIDKLKKDLFNFRFQKINGQLKNPAKIGNTKKTIARMKTLIQRKINA